MKVASSVSRGEQASEQQRLHLGIYRVVTSEVSCRNKNIKQRTCLERNDSSHYMSQFRTLRSEIDLKMIKI